MLQFIAKAEQLKVFDAGDEAVAIVRSKGFARYRAAFELVRFDVDAWAATLKDVVTKTRKVYTTREVADDAFVDQSREARELSEAFDAWVKKLHAAARAIAVSDHPSAKNVAALFRLGTFEGGSAENNHGDGWVLLENVARLADPADAGLPPGFIEEAKQLLNAMDPERSDAWSARSDRMAYTVDLHKGVQRIVDLLERFARYREFAMAMSGEEMPELGLAVIRSSLTPSEPTPALVPAPNPNAI